MNKTTTVIAWIALVIGIIALILAWTAFNRAGENLEQRIQDEVQELFQQNQQNQENTQTPAPDSTEDEPTNDGTGGGPTEGVRIDSLMP